MQSFGQLLRIYRRRCSDPLRGGLLTQERLGELIGDEIGGTGFSGAAVSDWERDKSKINADDRLVLVALATVLNQCGGLKNQAEADELLRLGNYRALDDDERKRAFSTPDEDSGASLKTSYVPPDSPSTHPLTPSPPQKTLSQRRQKQLILLQKVKNFWVEGVLEKSIQETGLMTLLHQRCDEVIDQPWEGIVGPADYDQESVTRWESIVELFLTAGHALLILGEPGSGKTMTLIKLASDLIQRAEADSLEPIPVILNLVSWSESRQDLDQWVVSELTAKYQIPRKTGRDWLERDELILLLDGFDEVPDSLGPRCAKVINQFRKGQGLTGIVVCSRIEEYLTAGVRLMMDGAISLLPLNKSQIDNYLAAAGPRLSALHAAVKQNTTLQDFARAPLMLSIMGQAYGNTPEDLTTVLVDIQESTKIPMTYWHRHLLDTYVKNGFNRRPLQAQFSPGETTYWLSWLARKMFDHNRSTFLVEQIQPSWLRNKRWRWYYMLISGLLTGIIGGIIVWLFLQLLRETTPLLPAPISDMVAPFLQITQGRAEALTIIITNIFLGLVVATMQSSYFERLRSQQIEMESHGWRYRRHLLQVGLVVGSITTAFVALFEQSLMAIAWGVIEIVVFVTVAGSVYGRSYLKEIRTVEALSWSWSKSAEGLIVGLILAVIAETLSVLIVDATVTVHSFIILGFVGMFLGGLRGRRVEAKNRSNHGIYLSMRNSFIAAAISAMFLVVITWSLRSPTYALISGLLIFIIAGSLIGGSNVSKHFLLRALLWIEGSIPWRYVSFLNHSAGLTFMRKVGGGYIYGHRMIQLYFASLTFPERKRGQPGTVETAGFQRAIDRALSKSKSA
jgi:hypothetical protein